VHQSEERGYEYQYYFGPIDFPDCRHIDFTDAETAELHSGDLFDRYRGNRDFWAFHLEAVLNAAQ
jgi:hypothetical protein